MATTSSQPTDTDLKDEWWQLFDAQTKRFYYYNAKRELTQWTRPFKSTPHPNHPHTQKEDKSTSSSSSSSSNSATLKMARSSSTASSGSSSMLDNIDSDERPNGSEEQNDQLISSNGNTVCLLASRLVALLMAQLDIDRVKILLLLLLNYVTLPHIWILFSLINVVVVDNKLSLSLSFLNFYSCRKNCNSFNLALWLFLL